MAKSISDARMFLVRIEHAQVIDRLSFDIADLDLTSHQPSAVPYGDRERAV
jgi:hypothetical protein